MKEGFCCEKKRQKHMSPNIEDVEASSTPTMDQSNDYDVETHDVQNHPVKDMEMEAFQITLSPILEASSTELSDSDHEQSSETKWKVLQVSEMSHHASPQSSKYLHIKTKTIENMPDIV